MMSAKLRIHDITQKIDRDKSTIIRWENQGLIPRAKRDSRGWRYYSEKEVRNIVKLVKETKYFQDKSNFSNTENKARKISYVGVAMMVMYMVYNLIGLGMKEVIAFTNQTTTMFTTVSAGILDIVTASSSNSFTGVTVSFAAQTATASDMGAFNVSDARGSGAGWTVNLAGNDWKAGEDVMQLDFDGTGSNGNLGKMCLIVASGAISSNNANGQDTTSITKGALDCFSAGVTSIDIFTAASSFGKGDYYITDFSLQQFIPFNPTAQNLTTTIVLTIV